MQAELDELGLGIKLLSINKADAESGVSAFTESHALPMVQDTSELGVWDAWGAVWRDVYIVDEDNVHIATYNLTSHSLATEENFEALKNMFIETATD